MLLQRYDYFYFVKFPLELQDWDILNSNFRENPIFNIVVFNINNPLGGFRNCTKYFQAFWFHKKIIKNSSAKFDVLKKSSVTMFCPVSCVGVVNKINRTDSVIKQFTGVT